MIYAKFLLLVITFAVIILALATGIFLLNQEAHATYGSISYTTSGNEKIGIGTVKPSAQFLNQTTSCSTAWYGVVCR